jgi:5'-nucleotidase
MRILVSNDDGIHHPGLHALVRAVAPLGDVIVSAPDRNRSGVGAGLTLHDPVRSRQIGFPVTGVRAYAVEGTPGDAVIMGLRRHAGGTVDAVVTGMNPGHNVSVDLLVSGTVGSALQAYLNGHCALAVSTAVVEDAASPVVAAVTQAVAAALPGHAAGRPMLVNMNFPRLRDPAATRAGDAGIRGVRLTVTSPRQVEDHVEPDGQPGRDHYWILRRAAAPAYPDPPANSDIRAIRDGHISITGLDWDLSPSGPAAGVEALVAVADAALRAGG